MSLHTSKYPASKVIKQRFWNRGTWNQRGTLAPHGGGPWLLVNESVSYRGQETKPPLFSLAAPYIFLFMSSCVCEQHQGAAPSLQCQATVDTDDTQLMLTTLEWMGMIWSPPFSLSKLFSFWKTWIRAHLLAWAFFPQPSPPWPLPPISEPLEWLSVDFFGEWIMPCLVTCLLSYYLFEQLLESCLEMSLFTSWCLSPQLGYTPQRSDLAWYFHAQGRLLSCCNKCAPTQSPSWGRTPGQWVDGPESQQVSSDGNML